MEIGSFIELDIPNTGEYYQDEDDIARLNTARAGIYHALSVMCLKTIYLPYYLCPTVKDFLYKKGITIYFYRLNKQFEPLLSQAEEEAAVLLSNYFGIFSSDRIKEVSKRFKHVIVDNSQSFFTPQIDGAYDVYSPRKFFGVPDGSYLLGPNASVGIAKYDKDSSSDTSAFLLKRIEKGCSAVYAERMENENRLDKSDILRMSDLSRRILQSIDYKHIIRRRLENFKHANSLFKEYNLLYPEKFMDQECVPMVYPLLIEDEGLVDKLKHEEIYTGRW